MTTVAWALMAVWGLANCLIFTVGYQHKTHGSWVHYPMGRHLMGFIVALGVVFALLSVALAVGSLPSWVWVLALALVNVFLTQRNFLLFTTRWRSRVSDASDDTIREERRP